MAGTTDEVADTAPTKTKGKTADATSTTEAPAADETKADESAPAPAADETKADESAPAAPAADETKAADVPVVDETKADESAPAVPAAPAADETKAADVPATTTPAKSTAKPNKATASVQAPTDVDEAFKGVAGRRSSPANIEKIGNVQHFLFTNKSVHSFRIPVLNEVVPPRQDGKAGTITLAIFDDDLRKVKTNVAQRNQVERTEAITMQLVASEAAASE